MALTIKQVGDALTKTAGNVSEAARKLGVSRTAIYNKINDHESLKELLLDTREELVDLAENELLKAVKAGNMTAIIFTLKTQGKARGYVERQEVTGAEGKEVTFRVIYDSSRPND